MKLFSGSSNKPLAEKVAKAMGLNLSPMEVFIFPDGERRIQIQERVVDEDTVIIQSTNTPVDQNYIELFLILDGLKRSGATTLTVVMPYMGYMRQDHIFRDGEAVSLEVMIHLLESLKVNRFMGFDFHTIKVPELFTIPVKHLSGLPVFAKEIKRRGWQDENSILISPDMGGLRRIQKISELLGDMPWVATLKNRDLNTGNVVIDHLEGPKEGTGEIGPTNADLKGKRALIVDDMISGGSIIETVKFIKSLGVKELYIFITHPLFSAKATTVLQASDVTTVFATDAVYIPEDRQFPKLEMLSISDMIAEELKASRV
jgi:ribose-phosphate pyrophosphokinase